MNKKIADFLAKNRPKGARSKVWPYREEVLELRESGASLQQVCDYLGEQGLHVSKQYLSVFIKQIERPISGLLKTVRIQTPTVISPVKQGGDGENIDKEKSLKMPYKKFDFNF